MDGTLGKPPPTLMLDSSNLAKTWKVWKEEFQLYLDLTLTEASESTKVKLFYYLVGETGRELCEMLVGSSTDDRTIKLLLEALDQHCNPKLNETVERYRFFMRNQGTDEGFDKYVTELKMLASTCNFGDIKDSLIRDRIVCSTNSPSLRERLLREENLTLQKCVQICRATELSRENSKTIEGKAVEEIHVLTHKTPKNDKQKADITCKFCGKAHERDKRKCPAYGETCRKCGKANHFAALCKSKRERGKVVNNVTETESEQYEDIWSITTESVNKVTKSLDGQPCQLFAGMLLEKNIIPINFVNPDVKIEKRDQVLVMYNKSTLKPVGKCHLKLRNPRKKNFTDWSLWSLMHTLQYHY